MRGVAAGNNRPNQLCERLPGISYKLVHTPTHDIAKKNICIKIFISWEFLGLVERLQDSRGTGLGTESQ